jgi:hypothetical protein
LLEIVFGFFVFSKRSFAGYVIQKPLERFFVLIVFSKRSFAVNIIQSKKYQACLKFFLDFLFFQSGALLDM